MTSFGYTLSSEEHPPRDLVENARLAEEAGFDFVSISDHYHPWVSAQGHSPFVWTVLGGIAAVTKRVSVGVGVTCPIIRLHPAIVAHAAATTSLMFGDRFFLGVGTGEALNEHVHGDRWPRPEVRREMLEEAVGVMRALWTGETVDHRGRYYEVENARIFDPPEHQLPVIVSGFGPEAASLAGRIGDGYWGNAPDRELMERVRVGGRRRAPVRAAQPLLGADRGRGTRDRVPHLAQHRRARAALAGPSDLDPLRTGNAARPRRRRGEVHARRSRHRRRAP